ncbi:hypothetical protein PHPALM_19579 [Phytophthora palmivora]|uniref:DNA-directed RNA polymerase III subunit RPC9 n=1 Tax=Phytophthora palmivora TaxID=4796 RepID=A0A2P4XH30_9STRA|nr:hypothetical protein PHPALM_19579 [Phytophthora palmivora]
MEPVTSKRRRPASVSPPPCQPTHDETSISWKKRRLEPASEEKQATEEKRPELRSPEPEEKKLKGKRRRSVTSEEKETQDETSNSSSNDETKRRRVVDSGTSPPPVVSASPVANLNERYAQTEQKRTEEKARFPPSPIVIPSREEDNSKENRENVATFSNLEEFIVSSQGSDADLVAACANLDDIVNCSQDSHNSEVERVRQRTSLRTVQVTPPPSARMLDRKNPPPPPKRPKRRRNYGGIVYARTYPRLALTPLVDDSPPSSPRVFRSLENEFAFAMQDTPEIRPRQFGQRSANQQFTFQRKTMKVLLINEGTLSDFEVLSLMQERKEQRLHKSAMVEYAERNWMDHKVLKFLTQSHSHCSTLSASCIQDFLKELAQAELPTLTSAEKLQFINHIPTELVDIHLIIEDCAGRFSETQVDELIRIVERTLGAELLEQRRNAETAQAETAVDGAEE